MYVENNKTHKHKSINFTRLFYLLIYLVLFGCYIIQSNNTKYTIL